MLCSEIISNYSPLQALGLLNLFFVFSLKLVQCVLLWVYIPPETYYILIIEGVIGDDGTMSPSLHFDCTFTTPNPLCMTCPGFHVCICLFVWCLLWFWVYCASDVTWLTCELNECGSLRDTRIKFDCAGEVFFKKKEAKMCLALSTYVKFNIWTYW